MSSSPGSTGSANKEARRGKTRRRQLLCTAMALRPGLVFAEVVGSAFCPLTPSRRLHCLLHRRSRPTRAWLTGSDRQITALSAHGNATAWRFPRRASLGEVSPTVEESVLRTGLADPTPSDAFPGCAARRVARMVHFSNLVSPSCLTHHGR